MASIVSSELLSVLVASAPSSNFPHPVRFLIAPFKSEQTPPTSLSGNQSQFYSSRTFDVAALSLARCSRSAFFNVSTKQILSNFPMIFLACV